MRKTLLRPAALLTAVFSILTIFALPVTAKVGDVKTYFSKVYAGDGGDANDAFLDNPQGFVADSNCNLFIADTQNFVVRQIDTSNVITTYAGSGIYGSTDGTSGSARMKAPSDIIIDNTNAFYVTDADAGTVRKISSGVVTTLMTGLKNPLGIATDNTSLFIADTGHNKIVQLSLTDNSVSMLATLTTPGKMTLLNGVLYVMSNNGTMFTAVNIATSAVTTIASGLQDGEGLTNHNGLVYFMTSTNGTTNQLFSFNPADSSIVQLQNIAETEWFNHGTDLTFCGGKLYLLFKSGSSIFTINIDGTNATKIAGAHRWNDVNGALSDALTGRPTAMTLSPDGKKVYLVENNKIKVINLKDKTLTFLAGHADDNYVDGVGGIARFSGVQQMVMSPGGTAIYMADRNNNRIRVFSLKTLAMTTLTGAGKFNAFNGVANGYAEGSACPGTDENGVGGCAYFDRPTGIAISKNGKTLYVADSFNHVIRTVDVASGNTKLLAGSTTAGMKDGVGSAARFKRPSNLLLSKDGNTLYILDSSAHAISAMNLKTKKVTRLMGTGKAGYLDGPWNKAVLSYPDTLSYGPGNSLLLTEVGSQRIRSIDLTKKTISLLAGSGQRGDQNGSQKKASFNQPRGVLMVSQFTALVADQLNDLMRVVSLK